MRAAALGAAALAGSALLLGGCTSLGSIAGAVTGAASGTGSANPALGYAVGIGTKAAVDALQHSLSRKAHRGEQDRMVAAVGTLPVGQTAAWQVRHTFGRPLNGWVTVVREIPNALSPCKEVIFTVFAKGTADGPRGYYATTACQHGDKWKWALAEPATGRWGNLQ